MCGIVFVKNNNDNRACRTVMKRYRHQSKRGTQGYGAISIEGGKIKQVYRSENEAGIREIYNDNAHIMLFHHRTPTSTPNLVSCTHPIHVSNEKLDYDYLVVHNGVISNDKTLKEDFEAMGFVYTTIVESYYKTGGEYIKSGDQQFNDSESLAIDLAIAIEEGKGGLSSYGSIAFVAIQYDKITNIVKDVFYGRNDRSPLKIDESNGHFVLASEGNGFDVEPHRLYKYNIRTNKVLSREFDVGYRAPDKPVVERVGTPVIPEVMPKRNDLIQRSVKINCREGDTSNWIEITVQGLVVYKTAIDISKIHLVTLSEWQKYQGVLKEIEVADSIMKNKDLLSPEDLEIMGKEYKRLYTWLGQFSRDVMARQCKLLENKF